MMFYQITNKEEDKEEEEEELGAISRASLTAF